jgi:transposase
VEDQKAYPSDLTDAEWEILEPLIPEVSPNATIPTIPRREIVNGILYTLRSGCPWRLLPNDLPAWGTVYYYFRTWRKASIWDQALEALRRQMRKAQGRDEEPSAAVIDSQSKALSGLFKHILSDFSGELANCLVSCMSFRHSIYCRINRRRAFRNSNKQSISELKEAESIPF